MIAIKSLTKVKSLIKFPHLIIGALPKLRIPGLHLALQQAVVPVLLVDLLPVRVHLHDELRVALLQAAARRVRALHLRLRLGQLVQQAALPVGHRPVVERQYGDDHHEEDEEYGREATSPSVCAKPNHIRNTRVSLATDCNATKLSDYTLPLRNASVYVTCRANAATAKQTPTPHRQSVINVRGLNHIRARSWLETVQCQRYRM